MLRRFVCAVLAFFLCAGVVLAEEIKGKIKRVGNHTLTVTADGKDQEIVVARETKLLSPKGEALQGGLENPHLEDGTEVVVQCEKKDGKLVASEVKLVGKKSK